MSDSHALLIDELVRVKEQNRKLRESLHYVTALLKPRADTDIAKGRCAEAERILAETEALNG